MRLPGIPAIHGGEEVRISRSGRRRVMAALSRLRHAKKKAMCGAPVHFAVALNRRLHVAFASAKPHKRSGVTLAACRPMRENNP
jgi:hypothetical protein